MSTQQFTKCHVRVVAKVDDFVLRQIDEERHHLGNQTRACVVRMALNAWARNRARTRVAMVEHPPDDSVAQVG